MVLVKNTTATGFDNIDEEPDVEIPRETLTEMQDWVESREFDDDDMLDRHRDKEYGEYIVDREHAHGAEDTVTIYHTDSIACLKLSEFLEL